MTATYSPAFRQAVARTLEAEGVFSDLKADRGGATKYGITERVAQRHGLRVRDLTVEQATGIYYEDYWQALGLDDVRDPRIAGEIFDTAVNCGPETAAKIAQKAAWFFGAYSGKIDGAIGPKTLAALNDLSVRYGRQLLLCLNGLQFMHYYEIADDNAEQRLAFFKGWMRRLEPGAAA